MPTGRTRQNRTELARFRDECLIRAILMRGNFIQTRRQILYRKLFEKYYSEILSNCFRNWLVFRHRVEE